MIDVPTFTAALLLGAVASGHCMVMCGGISGALGVATARGPDGRPRRSLLVGYQAGRILSYAVAGLIVGSIGDRLIAFLDADSVRAGLRIATGLSLAFAALVVFGKASAPDFRIGRWLWPRLAPLGRRLLPVRTLPRALAFGMIWGWMPCGLAYSMLLVAALTAHPLQAATSMLAFGAGTVPAMLAAAWGAPRIAAWTSQGSTRRGAGIVLLACALVVMASPWLLASMPGLHAWMPFDCTTALR